MLCFFGFHVLLGFCLVLGDRGLRFWRLVFGVLGYHFFLGSNGTPVSLTFCLSLSHLLVNNVFAGSSYNVLSPQSTLPRFVGGVVGKGFVGSGEWDGYSMYDEGYRMAVGWRGGRELVSEKERGILESEPRDSS